jgi:hypothetical protein
LINVQQLVDSLETIKCWVDTPRVIENRPKVVGKKTKRVRGRLDREFLERVQNSPELEGSKPLEELSKRVLQEPSSTTFENPKLYPFGFEVYFHTYNNKQRKQIDRALHVTWFTFKNKIPCFFREISRMDKGMRRHVIAAAWPQAVGETSADELGDLFIDVLSREIEEPGSSEVALYALQHADEIVKEMEGKKKEEVIENADSPSDPSVDSVDSTVND